MIVVSILFVGLYFLAYRPTKPTAEVSSIIQDCIELCQMATQQGVDLSNGPCLSDNNPHWDHPGWVCDVAHWPRQAVDNDPSNQCQEFRVGRASHFVEVDPKCNYIRHM